MCGLTNDWGEMVERGGIRQGPPTPSPPSPARSAPRFEFKRDRKANLAP